MNICQLLDTALITEQAACEAFDLAIHIAMVEAVKEISARWPRRKLELTASMGNCTINVTGASRGRPINWRFYWDSDGFWDINDVHYADWHRHQVHVGHKLAVESELIAKIIEMNDEVPRDPITYCPKITCIAGKVV